MGRRRVMRLMEVAEVRQVQEERRLLLRAEARLGGEEEGLEEAGVVRAS